jgi:hypothetical protein
MACSKQRIIKYGSIIYRVTAFSWKKHFWVSSVMYFAVNLAVSPSHV